MKKYSLEADNHSLEFSVDNEDGWCRVTLTSTGVSHDLGADRLRIVRDRLTHGLARQLTGDPAGVVDGLPVWWVVSFLERHCTIYVGLGAEGRTLYVQDAECEWLGSIALTSDDVQEWLTHLAAMHVV